MMNKKILVVDDELLIRESMCADLAQVGYQVDGADNGLQALTLLEQANYDLMVTDLMMDQMGGLELLAELRKRNNRIPVIIITGYAELETAIEGMRLGASDYLQKPYNRTELLLRIENSINKAELEKKVTFYEEVLPVCSVCHKVRVEGTRGLEEEGSWQQLEEYLKQNVGLDLSHGLCPECFDRLYGEQMWYKKMKQSNVDKSKNGGKR